MFKKKLYTFLLALYTYFLLLSTFSLFKERLLPQYQDELFQQSNTLLCSTRNRFNYEQLGNSTTRYSPFSVKKTANYVPKYFIAANFYNNQDVLPHLLTELLSVIDFLGNENVFVSIYENASSDYTRQILTTFELQLSQRKIEHKVVFGKLGKPLYYHRIDYLSKIRNKALSPLYSLYKKKVLFKKIVFLNDIYFCKNDILELIYQSDFQQSDVTCGLDLDFDGDSEDHGISFRDTWVARDISGYPFNKTLSEMVYHKETFKRFSNNLPFQVQCCWNGVAILNAAPFYLHPSLKFRRSDTKSKECSASECSLFCNDLWDKNYKKFVVVPRVRVAYSVSEFKELDKFYNYNQIPSPKEELVTYIDGPERVACKALDEYNEKKPSDDLQWVKYAKNTKLV
ncbi:hypothetical protein BB561_002863 [Smittium simulii]|uniref:Alpha-1,3-mannosyltransferase CMT1 n=1 Tax=Smittium simulii TaxID=133385 RepID=A0A2T9YP10_9FUNG|nr:hypothetical protein BB561_002863 [Smittium simulii]